MGKNSFVVEYTKTNFITEAVAKECIKRALSGLNLADCSFKNMSIFEAAEAGSDRFQYEVGYRYQNGDGVEQSEEIAAEWFSKSAAQGYAPAQFSLGRCYVLGCGVEKDIEKGVDLISKAAAQNNHYAQFFLAFFYESGEFGIEKNDEEAFNWYSKAIKNGSDDAKLELGRFYEIGKVVKQDLNMAAKYYKEALEADVEGAQEALNDLKKNCRK